MIVCEEITLRLIHLLIRRRPEGVGVFVFDALMRLRIVLFGDVQTNPPVVRDSGLRANLRAFAADGMIPMRAICILSFVIEFLHSSRLSNRASTGR